MTQQDIQILFANDRWANNRTLLAASALSAEELVRDLGGSYPSVRDTLVHIIGGEWIWLTYWKRPPATPPAPRGTGRAPSCLVQSGCASRPCHGTVNVDASRERTD